jgi:hypothetical protein
MAPTPSEDVGAVRLLGKAKLRGRIRDTAARHSPRHRFPRRGTRHTTSRSARSCLLLVSGTGFVNDVTVARAHHHARQADSHFYLPLLARLQSPLRVVAQAISRAEFSSN